MSTVYKSMVRTATLRKLLASALVAVPLWLHMRVLTSKCRMNGGLWSYTPQKSLFLGYNFLSSNMNIAFERESCFLVLKSRLAGNHPQRNSGGTATKFGTMGLNSWVSVT